MLKKIFIFALLISSWLVYGRSELLIPALRLPRGYQHAVLDEYEKNAFKLDVWAGLEKNVADQAYDNHNGRTKVPLSTLFFNTPNFTIAQSLTNPLSTFGKNLAISFAQLQPRFTIDRNTITFGMNIQWDVGSDCSWTVGARALVPYHLTKVILEDCCQLGDAIDITNLNNTVYACDQETVNTNGLPLVALNPATPTILTPSPPQLTAQNVCVYRMDLVNALRVDVNNQPLITSIPNNITIAAIPIGQTGTINNGGPGQGPPLSGNPVHILVSTDGTIPGRPWSVYIPDANHNPLPQMLTPPQAVATIPFLAPDGSNIVNQERFRFDGTQDYTPLFNNAAILPQLYLVPEVVPNEQSAVPNAALVGSGARVIIAQLNQAIQDSNISIQDFFSTPSVNLNFDSQRIIGLGDIKAQAFVGRTWCQNLWTEGWLELSLPTAGKNNNPHNLLFIPNGNNGHFELGLGGELDWDALCWLNLRLYGQYSWALKHKELVNASFQGASVSNFGPIQKANVSWGYFLGAVHTTFLLPTECWSGIDLGYEFYGKGKDHISFINARATDYTGNIGTLNNTLATARSNRFGHTFRGEFFFYINNIQGFLGFSHVFAGKNMAVATDMFIGITISY